MYPQDEVRQQLIYNHSMFIATIISGLLVHPVVGFATAVAWAVFWHYGIYWVPQKHPTLTEEEEAAVAIRRYFDGPREKSIEKMNKDIAKLKEAVK